MCWLKPLMAVLLISTISCELLTPDDSTAVVKPTPVIVVVTVAPTPTPVVIVVTATPEPSPTVAALAATPVPTPVPVVPTAQTPRASATPVPVATPPPPTATPKPLEPTRTPTPTVTAVPTSTPTPTATATPTSTPTPVPSPAAAVASPTPVATAVDPNRPDLRHAELKQYVLELINNQRTAYGRDPVALGRNVAAQLHAESMLDDCFASHWGLDGLKPHMRYTLAGSHQLGREEISGLSYCHTDAGSLPPYDDLRVKIEHSLGNWIGGQGTWNNIKRESHRTVNIGLAWNKYQVFMVLHFEEDYIERLEEATIEGEYLTLAARVRNGVVFDNHRNLLVEIVYHPPVHALTRGQLSRTYCYDSGRRIAALRPVPLGGKGHYLESYLVSYEPCANPYDVPADAPPPQSARDARNYHKEAADSEPVTYSIRYINADEWIVTEESFSIQAHIPELLATWGPGVYTVLVYGPVDGKTTLVLESPIFYGIDRPATYDRW